MEFQKGGKLVVEQGKVSAQVGASVDSDKDGRAAVEAGMHVKIDLAEVLDEVGKSNDQVSMMAIAKFIDAYGANLPKVEKEIAL